MARLCVPVGWAGKKGYAQGETISPPSLESKKSNLFHEGRGKVGQSVSGFLDQPSLGIQRTPRLSRYVVAMLIFTGTGFETISYTGLYCVNSWSCS